MTWLSVAAEVDARRAALRDEACRWRLARTVDACRSLLARATYRPRRC